MYPRAYTPTTISSRGRGTLGRRLGLKGPTSNVEGPRTSHSSPSRDISLSYSLSLSLHAPIPFLSLPPIT